MKKSIWNIFITFCFICSISLFARADEEPERFDEIKRNALELDQTSDGFYIGLERVLFLTPESILILDAKNTNDDGENSGLAGLTFRFGATEKKVFSSRIETAWQKGQKNISLKLGYDNPLLGLAMTGIKGVTDPEFVRTQDLQVVESSTTSEDTLISRANAVRTYERTTTTTSTVNVRETRFATPDGLLLDIYLNMFRQLDVNLGGSYWESESWNETGFHVSLAWHLTQDDIIGSQGAHVGGETEGGIFFKKRFSSFGDLFKKGRSFKDGKKPSLMKRLMSTSFSTPPIKILTASEYNEDKQEVRTEVKKEEVRVIVPDSPVVSSFVLDKPAPGELGIDSVTASDPDGTIVSWSVRSNLDGLLASGSWPIVLPYSFLHVFSNGTHTITFTVRDNDGNTGSARRTVVMP